MFLKGDTSDYDKLYSLDVLGVENRGEDDQLQVYEDFKENIVRRNDGRYEVSVPWITVSELSGTNEQASRGRLPNVERKQRKKSMRRQWRNKLATGINKKAPQTCTHWRAYLASICYKSQESERMQPPPKLGWFLTQAQSQIKPTSEHEYKWLNVHYHCNPSYRTSRFELACQHTFY